MGCLNQHDGEDNKYRIIEVVFKSDTNVTYKHYISQKYNISIISSSIRSDGSLSTCEYNVPSDTANEIIEWLKSEEKVEYVVFADVHG